MRSAITGDRIDSSASGTLVIFSRVEGLLRESTNDLCEVPREQLTAILTSGVPLVLVSDAGAADLRRLQRELGLRQPFICEGGASLHIPPAYFSDVGGSAAEDGWETFSFATTGPAAAIRLLSALFTATGRANILTVGLGCDERDRTMLAAVDIPIVVRSRQEDQQALLQFVPGAYVTHAPGTAGWLEAVLGTPFSDA